MRLNFIHLKNDLSNWRTWSVSYLSLFFLLTFSSEIRSHQFHLKGRDNVNIPVLLPWFLGRLLKGSVNSQVHSTFWLVSNSSVSCTMTLVLRTWMYTLVICIFSVPVLMCQLGHISAVVTENSLIPHNSSGIRAERARIKPGSQKQEERRRHLDLRPVPWTEAWTRSAPVSAFCLHACVILSQWGWTAFLLSGNICPQQEDAAWVLIWWTSSYTHTHTHTHTQRWFTPAAVLFGGLCMFVLRWWDVLTQTTVPVM